MTHILDADKHSLPVQRVAERFDTPPGDPDTRQISVSFARLAQEMLGRIEDQEKMLIGLTQLLGARDAFLAAHEADRAIPQSNKAW